MVVDSGTGGAVGAGVVVVVSPGVVVVVVDEVGCSLAYAQFERFYHLR